MSVSNQGNAPVPNAGYSATSGFGLSDVFITVLETRDPTTYDFNYPVKKRWINTTIKNEWILTGFSNVTGQTLANWILLTSSGLELESLTGNIGGAVFGDVNNNINVVGDGTTISITGNPGTNTLTASLIGNLPAIEKITVQTGTTTIIPSAGNINVNGAAVAASGIPVQTNGTGVSTYQTQVQASSQQASSNLVNAGLASFNSAQFSVNSATGFVALKGGSNLPAIETFTLNNGAVIVPDASGNVNVLGNTNAANNGYSSYTTGTTASSNAQVVSYGTAKWVVNKTAGIGTHQTIASAIASASLGDTIFVTPSSTAYVENITLKAGVNITGFATSELNTLIQGTITASFSGACELSGLMLINNGSSIISVTGSNVTQLKLIECFFVVNGATGITSTNSNGSINISECSGNILTANKLFDITTNDVVLDSNGLFFKNTYIENSVSNAISSTISGGAVRLLNSKFIFPITTSSNAILQIQNSVIDSSLNNSIALTINSTGNNSVFNSTISSGSAASISIGGTSTLSITGTSVNSSAINVVVGTGTLAYGPIVCLNSSGVDVGITKSPYSIIT